VRATAANTSGEYQERHKYNKTDYCQVGRFVAITLNIDIPILQVYGSDPSQRS
jgi:hypothetical protein